jgi:hypothetical protein
MLLSAAGVVLLETTGAAVAALVGALATVAAAAGATVVAVVVGAMAAGAPALSWPQAASASMVAHKMGRCLNMGTTSGQA